MALIHLPADGYRRERWRNGGGWTRQIAAGTRATPVFTTDTPMPAWDWRLSIAEVESDGPFSTFPGIDRTLVLLSGAGMDLLSPDGTVIALATTLARADFPGERAITGRLHHGATTDFNLMWRRGVLRASLQVLPLAEAMQGWPRSAWLTVLHLLDGALATGAGIIASGDTLLLQADLPSAGNDRVDAAASTPPRVMTHGMALLIAIDPVEATAAIEAADRANAVDTTAGSG